MMSDALRVQVCSLALRGDRDGCR